MKALIAAVCFAFTILAASCDSNGNGTCATCCECQCCGKSVTTRPNANAPCLDCAGTCSSFCDAAYKCSSVTSAVACTDDGQDAGADATGDSTTDP